MARHRLKWYLAECQNVSKLRLLGFEHWLYQLWDIQQSRLVRTKHVIFNECVIPFHSDYGKFIRHSGEPSKPSIGTNKEQLPDIENSRTEKIMFPRTETGAIKIIWQLMIMVAKKNKLLDIHKKKARNQICTSILPAKAPTLTAMYWRSAAVNLQKWLGTSSGSGAEKLRAKCVNCPKMWKKFLCKWVLKLKQNADEKLWYINQD